MTTEQPYSNPTQHTPPDWGRRNRGPAIRSALLPPLCVLANLSPLLATANGYARAEPWWFVGFGGVWIVLIPALCLLLTRSLSSGVYFRVSGCSSISLR